MNTHRTEPVHGATERNGGPRSLDTRTTVADGTRAHSRPSDQSSASMSTNDDDTATTRGFSPARRTMASLGLLHAGDGSEGPGGADKGGTRPTWQEHERWRAGQAGQREGFDAIVAQGRPTTVEVKGILEWLAKCAAKQHDSEHHVWAGASALASLIIDRLGCALIAQDAEVAHLNDALDFVAKAAVPLDDAGLAGLVQEARIMVETLAAEAERSDDGPIVSRMTWRGIADQIGRLVAAILDQARKAQAVREAERFDASKPTSTRQNGLRMIEILTSFVPTGGVLSADEASRAIGTFRQLIAAHDDLEVHRDAARDAMSDAIIERDEAYAKRAAAIVDRNAADAAHGLAVRDHASAMAALRADLHRVQANTATYREESRREVEAIRERTAPCVALVARIAGWSDEEADTAGGQQVRMIAQRAAEGIVDAFPHTYTDDDCERAIGRIRARVANAGHPFAHALVGEVAEALGMRRAGA